MEEFEREFQAKLDFCAQVTLERQLIRMVKSKKVEVKEANRIRDEQIADIKMRMAGFLKVNAPKF